MATPADNDPLWLDDLNPRQREAAVHGDGPLLVVAGAGTGKTRTLAYRVAHLVHRGTPPERILLLPVTRRAAQELSQRARDTRARDITRSSGTPRIWGGTFHSVAARLLRRHPDGSHRCPAAPGRYHAYLRNPRIPRLRRQLPPRTDRGGGRLGLTTATASVDWP